MKKDQQTPTAAPPLPPLTLAEAREIERERAQDAGRQWYTSPYHDGRNNDPQICCEKTGRTIAVVYRGPDAKADAVLMAAAPKLRVLLDLLDESRAALEVLIGDIEDTYPARAEAAADLAMRCRTAIREARCDL